MIVFHLAIFRDSCLGWIRLTTTLKLNFILAVVIASRADSTEAKMGSLLLACNMA